MEVNIDKSFRQDFYEHLVSQYVRYVQLKNKRLRNSYHWFPRKTLDNPDKDFSFILEKKIQIFIEI